MYKPYMELVPLNMKGGVAAEVRESLWHDRGATLKKKHHNTEILPASSILLVSIENYSIDGNQKSGSTWMQHVHKHLELRHTAPLSVLLTNPRDKCLRGSGEKRASGASLWEDTL